MSGLGNGSVVELLNNGADVLKLSANGSFSFSTPVTGSYAVTVDRQPTLAKCTVTGGAGTVETDVTSVTVQCATSGVVTTLAGSGARATVDGAGTAASFNHPAGIASDAAGNLYVTQWGDGKLRKISPSGDVTTLASGLDLAVGVALSPGGEIYVAASGQNKIVKVSPTGNVTPFAGSGDAGSVDGTATSASFNRPYGLAFDSAGHLHVSELEGHRIRKVSPDGDVTTLAGSGSQGGVDGTGTAASFNFPAHIAVGPDGNVYVAGNQNPKIRKITPAGVVTTIAGNDTAGSADDIGIAASFRGPFGIAVDAAGVVYVTEFLGHKLRRIDPNGVVTTLAGTGTAGSADGAAGTATLSGPAAVLIDAEGNLVIVDHWGGLIRKISRE